MQTEVECPFCAGSGTTAEIEWTPMGYGFAGHVTGSPETCTLCYGTGRCTMVTYRDEKLVLHKTVKKEDHT